MGRTTTPIAPPDAPIIQKTPRVGSWKRSSEDIPSHKPDQERSHADASDSTNSPRYSEDGCVINLDESTLETAEGESVQVGQICYVLPLSDQSCYFVLQAGPSV